MNLSQQIANKRFHKINDAAKVVSTSIDENKPEINLIGSPQTNKLRIAYLMNHVRVCGGAKIILEHTNQLVARGHEVYIICRDPKPTWKEINAAYIQAEQQRALVEFVPDVDIIVCTVADQVPETYLFGKAPVVLFEQGDIYIYEFEKVQDELKKIYQLIWNTPIPIFGVSKVLLDTLEKNFGRKGNIIHNALDRNIFFPRDTIKKEGKLKVLFVGQEENTFKGISVIREAIKMVRNWGYDFDEFWVTQTPPQSHFDGALIVNPTQEKLGETYRECDIFISGSFYESFPLPPLEAMASGCAVISTNNLGIQEYAVNGVNSLLGNVGDSKSLAECLMELLTNESKREDLVRKGYETAESFHWDSIMTKWESMLTTAIEYSKQENQPTPSLRIEKIPDNISVEAIHDYQKNIMKTLNEDWCLFLYEGELLDESLYSYVQQVLQKGKTGSFLVPVIYAEEVPGHPIVRLEKRLFPKKDLNRSESLVIPIEITNGNGIYCQTGWKKESISLYKGEQFEELVQYLKSRFTNLSNTDKLIACRWIVLGLIELNRYQEALSVIDSALGLDPTYSDLLYLGARILSMNNNVMEGKKFFEFAQYCGTALYHEDTFLYMSEICTAYLNNF